MKIDQRMTVVAFDGSADIKVVMDRCRPPDGKEVSTAIATPERVDREFAATFGVPLSRAFEAVVKPAPAAETHLVALLSNVAASLRYRGGASSIVLEVFSDMAENTPSGTLISGRRKPMDAAGFKHYFQTVSKDRMTGVRLVVRTITTPASTGSARRIREAWSTALSAAGVQFEWRPL